MTLDLLKILDSPYALALVVVIGLVGTGGIVAFFRVRSQNRRDDAEAEERKATSAEVLAKAYSVLVDDLRKDLNRQDGEIKDLRAELKIVVDAVATKDRELSVLRLELANERTKSAHLQNRVTELEDKVRQLDPDQPPARSARSRAR